MSGITVFLTDINGKTHEIADAKEGASLMEVARENDVEGIIAECGGACSCATCHVYIDAEWFAQVGEADDVEEDMLDMVDDVRRATSRLSCQIKLSTALDGLKAEVAPEL